MRDFRLGTLADPTRYQGPIDLGGFAIGQLRNWLRGMLEIRLVEQHLGEMRKRGFIGGPVHLGVGQEAIAIGVSSCLAKTDRIFSGHRSHSHLLAVGGSVHRLFAEVLGKDTGHSRGMGGSMHLWDQPNGFHGSVPIVAGTVPLAVGAGLAARLSGTEDVGVCYFGDGAVEEGAVHESLNLARNLNSQVLFVVENNLFASHMHIALRQPKDSTARFAAANDIRYEVVDGNDVAAVAGASRVLVEHARSGAPAFLEAITYRWYGHVDWREDIDVGVNRSVEDLRNWRRRDPIARLSVALINAGQWSESDSASLVEEIRQEIDVAWDQAMSDPYPPTDTLMARVYPTSRGA